VTIWLVLLAGCVLFGALVVAALVLPRAAAPLAVIGGVAALLMAVAAFGAIAQQYATPEAIVSALAVLLAGVGAGFAVAATSLPHLARTPKPPSLPSARDAAADGRGVVLVSCAEPDRYSPRAVAARQNLLAESADINVPATALPFVFFADKARYRAVGGRSPATSVARQLAASVAERLRPEVTDVLLAWCHDPTSLAAAVSTLAAAGVARATVVVLGPVDSGPLDAARVVLGQALRENRGPDVIFASPVWEDRWLPERLAERILAATTGVDSSAIGVVLMDAGLPPVWERKYSATQRIENYFDQRVRVLLSEAGVTDQHVRVAWLEWQTPDVTEAVRHLAALGCRRIVVAAATIALPTLETALDLGHAITLARVPQGVQVVTVTPWGDDERFVDAICRAAQESLQLDGPRAPVRP
jgi:protoheme ferro-lyase